MEFLLSYVSTMSLTSWLLILLIILAVVYSLSNFQTNKGNVKQNLPPGPKGYPILGTFPSFMKAPAHIVFQEWSKRYGNVFQFALGTGTSVVLGDVDTIREAFVEKAPDVDSRCQWRYCFIKTFRGLSTLPYSLKWMNTRRRTTMILRDFGMGKSFLEERIYEETLCMINAILEKGQDGKANFSPLHLLRKSPMNTLCSILFGKRYDHENPGLLYLLNSINNITHILATASIYDILPNQLRRLFGFSLRHFHKNLKNMNNFMAERVKEHKETYKNQEAKSFVDAWLKARDQDASAESSCLNPHLINTTKRCANGYSQEKEYSNLPDVLQDIMFAGAHSTGIVLQWSILFLVLHKEEQDKVYQEIMDVIGSDRTPCMGDRPKLKYFNAVFQEIMRCATVLPIVAHATARDTVIGGYDVQAQTEVIYNNWSLNHDEKVFPEPYVFKPSRWLDEEGNMKKELLQKVFPFGIGKRACVGAALARMQLYITITTLVQNIELLLPDKSTPESLLPKVVHQIGLLANCKPFLMRARKRTTSATAA